jgi:Fur family peroxide stress response transcriptional regulator|uniref:Transcriptional repressor n=1 Tax=Desulfobacca acetoxidans TaxID=60893 RepID=A0A7C5ALJ6_9BACT
MKNLIEKLRSRRISVTPQRLAVLSVLETRRDHPTAEQIYQEVRRQLPAISFNTVYKTLEVLCQKGLVIKVNPLHERARYDIDTSSHAHLVCRHCQFIVDLPEEVVPPITLPPEERAGFQVERQSLIFWGLCPRCQVKAPIKEEAS